MKIFGRRKETEKTCSCCSCGGCGAQSRDTGSPIKVLGSGCQKCNQLEEAVREALAGLGMDDGVDHVTDCAQIAAYGVMSTPALVVDGKVVSAGRVLSKDEAMELIRKARG